MSYDVIVVGGGLGGSTLAAQVARDGARVLVLEREERFKDRVRGENMLPWGVAAARRLRILDDLVAAGGHSVQRWKTYAGGQLVEDRDLVATTPGRDGALNVYHPDMQEALLGRAIAAGAEVRRGATALSVESAADAAPAVTFTHGGERRSERARIVVCADGRVSAARAWCGFESRRNPELLMIAGTLVEGTSVPDDSTHVCFGDGVATLVAPLGGRRARTYFVYRRVDGARALSGAGKFAEFMDGCRSTGAQAAWFDGVVQAGPLAEFESADRWVEFPSRNGVALVGDAAAASDPAWGCGLSLTLLDVEELSRCLHSTDDWRAALDCYAQEHDEYYGALHRILGWMTELAWTRGPAADERRQRVFRRLFSDPSGFPDAVGLGPRGPSDERARRLILGEEDGGRTAPGSSDSAGADQQAPPAA